MKKTLIALAALAASASFAQSSVTIWGIVDAGYASVKNAASDGNPSRTVSGITNSGLNSSRLGFRGTEDLGGGMTAGFWLETALNNDDNTTSVNFARRSTVSLMGGFGEVRIGRDYTPTFWNTTVYDAFGTNGIGSAPTVGLWGSANTTAVRSNNSVSYFTPAMGGFTAQVMLAFGENAKVDGQTASKNGDYFGARVGYANGPLSVHGAFGERKGATSILDIETTNLGASYDFGMIKPALFVGQEELDGVKFKAMEISATAPVGAGEIRVAYSNLKLEEVKASKFAVGYVHNLSKRTAVYGTIAATSNKNGAALSISNNGISNANSNVNGASSGYEVGVRHSF